MDPITVRDLAPRLALGLFIAVAAAAAVFSLDGFDGRSMSRGETVGVVGAEI